MNAKRRLYEGVIIPTALYGAETWHLRESERSRLDIFGMSEEYGRGKYNEQIEE